MTAGRDIIAWLDWEDGRMTDAAELVKLADKIAFQKKYYTNSVILTPAEADLLLLAAQKEGATSALEKITAIANVEHDRAGTVQKLQMVGRIAREALEGRVAQQDTLRENK